MGQEGWTPQTVCGWDSRPCDFWMRTDGRENQHLQKHDKCWLDKIHNIPLPTTFNSNLPTQKLQQKTQNLNPTTTKTHTHQHLTTKTDELPSVPLTQQSKQMGSMAMFWFDIQLHTWKTCPQWMDQFLTLKKRCTQTTWIYILILN